MSARGIKLHKFTQNSLKSFRAKKPSQSNRRILFRWMAVQDLGAAITIAGVVALYW
jgi:hypothetical protein